MGRREALQKEMRNSVLNPYIVNRDLQYSIWSFCHVSQTCYIFLMQSTTRRVWWRSPVPDKSLRWKFQFDERKAPRVTLQFSGLFTKTIHHTPQTFCGRHPGRYLWQMASGTNLSNSASTTTRKKPRRA